MSTDFRMVIISVESTRKADMKNVGHNRIGTVKRALSQYSNRSRKWYTAEVAAIEADTTEDPRVIEAIEQAKRDHPKCKIRTSIDG